MTLGQMIRNYRWDHKISQREFASKCGLSRTYVAQLESGLNPTTGKAPIPTVTTLNDIANAMGISFDDLIWTVDDMTIDISEKTPSELVDIPILGSVAAGFDKWEVHEFGKMPIQRSWLHNRSPKEFFLLRVFGDSMTPDYQEGDFVLCLNTSDMGMSGKVGVVVDSYGEATLKRINYPMSGNPEYGMWMELEPLNKKYETRRIEGEDLNDYYVQGRVMMVIREVDKP